MAKRDLGASLIRSLGGRSRGGNRRRQGDEMFRALLEAAPDAMVIVGDDGRMLIVNRRAEEIFGAVAAVMLALGLSRVSRAINTSFVERQNATDRHRNARKARKTYRFSKRWQYHESVTYLSLYITNFCWPVRTLAERDDRGHWRQRSPAMAAGLADHVWPMAEWFSLPAVRRC